ESHHNARFCSFAVFLRTTDLLQTTVILRLWAYQSVQAWYRLHIVRHNLLPCTDHSLQRPPGRSYIRYEGFDGGTGAFFLNCTHRLIPYLSTTVFEFVPVHRGNYSMFHLHQRNGFRHTVGFVFIILRWSPGLYSTERTRPGTNIAQNHKRGCTGSPTFSHIGAIPALANRMKIVLVHQTAYLFIIFPDW